MRIDTQRFGTLHLNEDQLFLFPQGLIGMETLRHWALLPDFENPSVAWLQSATRGDRAIASDQSTSLFSRAIAFMFPGVISPACIWRPVLNCM